MVRCRRANVDTRFAVRIGAAPTLSAAPDGGAHPVRRLYMSRHARTGLPGLHRVADANARTDTQEPEFASRTVQMWQSCRSFFAVPHPAPGPSSRDPGPPSSDDVAVASTVISPSFVVMMPPKMSASTTTPTTETPAMSTPVASDTGASGVAAGDVSVGGETRGVGPALDAGDRAPSQSRSGEDGTALEHDRGSGQGDAGLVQGPALENAVTEIMSMGFSEAETRRALRMVRRMLHAMLLEA